MKTLTDRLRDADPVAREPRLDPDIVAALRRTVVAAAREAEPADGYWFGRQLALASALLALTVGGLLSAHRVTADRQRHAGAGLAPRAASEQPTQLHFSTPGGTRVVWTIDPGFQLRGTEQ